MAKYLRQNKAQIPPSQGFSDDGAVTESREGIDGVFIGRACSAMAAKQPYGFEETGSVIGSRAEYGRIPMFSKRNRGYCEEPELYADTNTKGLKNKLKDIDIIE